MEKKFNLENELKKILEDNAFLLMFSKIIINEDGNTQIHNYKNFIIEEYQNIVKKFDDERLFNFKNNLGQAPFHSAFRDFNSHTMKLFYTNPKINKFAVDDEGNNIFHYCFKSKY